MAEIGVGESKEPDSDVPASVRKGSRLPNKPQDEIELIFQMQNLDQKGQHLLIEKLIEQGNRKVAS